MAELISNFTTNFVENQLKRSIQVLLEAECLSSAVVLIYAGMDTMAWIGMPVGQQRVTRGDFVRWSAQYIRFPCSEQLTGEDLYGARCAMVHQYGMESDISRSGKCRLIGYISESAPEVTFKSAVDPDFVIVSISALAGAFFKGVDRFLTDTFADMAKASVTEERLQKIVNESVVDGV